MNEVQKQQALAETQIQIETSKNNLEIERMQIAAQLKEKEMEVKFGYDMQLTQADVAKDSEREAMIEDRKDKRTKMQATQQSTMINQRKNDLLPTDFESPELENLNGFGAEQF